MAGAGSPWPTVPSMSLWLRSSPAWNGRCWQPAKREAIAGYKLRSSPAWNGRCWKSEYYYPPGEGRELRSSPAWNGRCWRKITASLPSWTACCDPHRLGMAGAGRAIPRREQVQGRRCDPHRLGMAGAGAAIRLAHSLRVEVAILTGLEWPVLADRRPAAASGDQVAILTGLDQ